MKNKGVLYTGKVGARIKAPSSKPRLIKPKAFKVLCVDGPFKFHFIWLTCECKTLPFKIGSGKAGQYTAQGKWIEQ